MLIWFVATAWWAVWIVLKDRRFDYRTLAIGAVLPDVVDGVTGGIGLFHSIVAGIGLLVAVMAVTFGRRPIRRRLLALPFGVFLHLVFDGAFNVTSVFWWPLAGERPADRTLPSIDRGVWSLVLEAVGIVLLWVWWRRFELGVAAHRSSLLRTGQLPPERVPGDDGAVPTC